MTEAATTKSAGDRLKAFIDRIERSETEKREISDDIKAIYAEAKANGFDTKVMRHMVKRRQKDPSELAEAETILQSYMVAMGMATDRQLHDAVRALADDELGRDEVIDSLKLLVPVNGEIIARVGGDPVRIWRDEAGQAYVAAFVAPKAEKAAKSAKPSATVLSIVPKDWVKSAADAAEKRSRGEAPADEDEGETVE